MSGAGFYAVKILAIATVTIVYFVVLIAVSMALSKVMPDDPKEDLFNGIIVFLLQAAVYSIAFYAVRT